MTHKELAALLTGREYGREISVPESMNAARDGLVVIFGYSDDNIEFRGAIKDEISAFDGTEVFIDLDAKAVLPKEGDDYFCQKCLDRARKMKVIAKWCPPGDLKTSWLITVEGAEFEPFDIMEDGELFCRGAVVKVGGIVSEGESPKEGDERFGSGV
jgi:hypothetical protein